MIQRGALSCLIAVTFATSVLACTSADEDRSGSTRMNASAPPTAPNGMRPGDASDTAADSGKASSPPRPVDDDGGKADERDAASTFTPSPQLASCLAAHHIELMPLDSLRAVAREIARIEARCAPAHDELARIASGIGRGL